MGFFFSTLSCWFFPVSVLVYLLISILLEVVPFGMCLIICLPSYYIPQLSLYLSMTDKDLTWCSISECPATLCSLLVLVRSREDGNCKAFYHVKCKLHVLDPQQRALYWACRCVRSQACSLYQYFVTLETSVFLLLFSSCISYLCVRFQYREKVTICSCEIVKSWHMFRSVCVSSFFFFL